VVAGGDWFHVDSMRMTTTKGTPQDVDGSFFAVLEGGINLAVAQIEAWRAVAPKVEVKIVRGNHDYITTAMLGLYLRGAYANDRQVSIGEPMNDREYIEVGRTLVGLTHGDGVKDEKLSQLMAYEAREAWGRTDRRLWLTGHWHSQITTETHGVLIRHLPSLSGTDEWHHRSGYVGNRRSLAALVLDPVDGLWCEVTQDAK
jgi:predicted phosphodiesterase